MFTNELVLYYIIDIIRIMWASYSCIWIFYSILHRQTKSEALGISLHNATGFMKNYP